MDHPHPELVSNPSIRACGTAEPPHGTIRSDDRSPPLARTWRSSSLKIVGTPPASVTRSLAISRVSGSGCRNRSGMIRSAPAMTAA